MEGTRNEHHEIYQLNSTTFIRDISILHQWLLFLDKNDGLKAIDKNGSLHSVTVTGLDYCSYYMSIHAMAGKRYKRFFFFLKFTKSYLLKLIY